ncbi:HEAT repeat domain-containing protein [Rhodospira trueperi]|uniref:HEAT repeat-containing protein n=1 Tax=Rhodospira trueperi TaxID=69960 RepID=A0A1G7HAP9_9PROT|nr:HEAT repeat domain-containing protein [Rhodospira trueperi]SDE97456.1 HEAT repeat-containing protein [Rhodospira trueperi]
MPLSRTDSGQAPGAEAPESIGTVDQAREHLGDSDSNARRRAARAFVDFGGDPAVLCRRLEDEDNLAVIELAMTALVDAATGSDGDSAARRDTVEALISLMRSKNASVRVQTVSALQQVPDETAAFVPALMSDPDPNVRILTANLLQDFAHPDTHAWLRALLRTDTHVNVCMAAVEALAETGTPDMVEDLDRLVDRFPDQPFVAAAVAQVRRLIEGRSEPDGS